MNARYIRLSVPGLLDDGSDTTWYVFDSQSQHITDVLGKGDAACARAQRRAEEYERHGRVFSWRNDVDDGSGGES